MVKITVEEFASDLRAVAAGKLSEAQFRAKYDHAGQPAFINHVWDGLEHFLADADIRAKDETYRQMQEEELDRLIELLRERAPEKQLRRVTFLGPSKR